MARKALKFVLVNDGEDPVTLEGRAEEKAGLLQISVEGYGNVHGPEIVFLALQDGKLRVILADQYDSDQTQTLDMEGAQIRRKDWDPRHGG